MNMKKLSIFLALMIFFSAASAAKSSLTKEEKMQLAPHHGIIKKGGPVLKKSSLNSIRAKLKREGKEKKQAKRSAGI